jgi:hypothetical protein
MTTWPDTLYHYTSWQAFVAIVQSKSLRLSGRWNLNDSNEGAVFPARLRELAASLPRPVGPPVENVLEPLARLEAYIGCFSADPDLLSQWRGYAANGAGVCVGFSRAALFDVVRGDSRALLRPVTYADSVGGLNQETTDLMRAMLMSTGTPNAAFLQSAAKVMWEIKNRAFSEEREYRLILMLEEIMTETPLALLSGATVCRNWRGADEGLREFVELNFAMYADRLLTEVVLGPRCDSHPDVLRRFLAARGFPATTVRKSVASYR